MHGDHATRVALVPGAAGSAAFWTPITERLPEDWTVTAIDLPGLGSVPARDDIRGYDDLAEYGAGIVAALAYASPLGESIGETVRYPGSAAGRAPAAPLPRQHKRKALASANGKARYLLRVTAEA